MTHVNTQRGRKPYLPLLHSKFKDCLHQNKEITDLTKRIIEKEESENLQSLHQDLSKATDMYHLARPYKMSHSSITMNTLVTICASCVDGSSRVIDIVLSMQGYIFKAFPKKIIHFPVSNIGKLFCTLTEPYSWEVLLWKTRPLDLQVKGLLHKIWPLQAMCSTGTLLGIFGWRTSHVEAIANNSIISTSGYSEVFQ